MPDQIASEDPTLDPRDDTDAPPPAPRWVKVLGIAAVILVLAFVLSHLVGGGFRNHGP
jgi:hypothetical protein